jgi:putative acetyltransferase
MPLPPTTGRPSGSLVRPPLNGSIVGRTWENTVADLVEASSKEDYETARGLLGEYAAWLGVDLCFQGFAQELEHLSDVYGPPTGCLVIARSTQGVVGCVGVRALSGETCEMKRLFVRDVARGNGLGRKLAAAAVEAARRLGYQRMVLDTLESMSAARSVYTTLGFQETAPYYANPLPGVCYMALSLVAT